ncbi:MAG: type II secretion system F family protein, partial [Chloroflexi bacterium]|nr:type II secretion system F family protein [Chloroflexota bacterium]
MELASREAPTPTNIEFGRVVAEISLGLSPEEALNNLVRRIPSADLDLMVTSMNINREVGGNLAQVLDAIGITIRERMRIKGDIETKTAQVQGSAYIISALPILIGLVIFLLNGKFMKPMFKFPYIIMYICAGM